MSAPTEPAAEAEVDLLDLDDPRAGDPALTGGKAATLATLRQGGLPVPAGVVVTTRALARLSPQAGEAPSQAEPPTPALPDDVADAVDRALRAWGDRAVAVRSSAVAEDLADASYAGQYETVLGARGASQVIDALCGCAASARSARVSAYAGDGAGGAIAVLIQPLVDADAAGVAFTANPVTGARNEVRISAVVGLGDRLVAGEASGDEWVVRSHGASCVTCPEGALDEARAGEIAALARRVEAHAGAPQDIEWALAGGELWLLQARPITALPVQPAIEVPPGTWFKDTTHYTGPMSPLGATAYLPRMEHGGSSMLAEFGFLVEAMRQRPIGWEVYAQAVPPTSDEVVAQRLANAVQVLRSDRPAQLVEAWWHGGWREAFRDRIDALRAPDLTALDDAALDAHLQACLDLLADGQIAHFQLFVPYLLGAYDLVATCEELLGWDMPAALELVAGLSQASSEPTRDLAELAAGVRAEPAARDVVAAWSPEQPVSQLQQRLRGVAPELADHLAGHLERYGCRVPNYDVGDPTFAERPELTLRLLADLVTGEQDPRAAHEQLAATRRDAAARARAVLAERDADDRARFEEVLARAEQVWGLREDNLVYTDAMPNGLVRLAALEIGRRLVARGLLRHREDAVWCELDELRGALAAPDAQWVAQLRQRVARRRAEQAWVRANPGPPLYGDPPADPPPMDELPAEAQRLAGAMQWLMRTEFAPPGEQPAAGEVRGQPGSPGRVTAPARVVADESEFDRVGPGEVLVCTLTTPAWTVLFSRAAAVVTDRGSAMSHAAIVAREHGIPAVVGTHAATATIADGQTVTVDGGAGLVWLGA